MIPIVFRICSYLKGKWELYWILRHRHFHMKYSGKVYLWEQWYSWKLLKFIYYLTNIYLVSWAPPSATIYLVPIYGSIRASFIPVLGSSDFILPFQKLPLKNNQFSFVTTAIPLSQAQNYWTWWLS